MRHLNLHYCQDKGGRGGYKRAAASFSYPKRTSHRQTFSLKSSNLLPRPKPNLFPILLNFDKRGSLLAGGFFSGFWLVPQAEGAMFRVFIFKAGASSVYLSSRFSKFDCTDSLRRREALHMKVQRLIRRHYALMPHALRDILQPRKRAWKRMGAYKRQVFYAF
jgi:hypothetical protein